MSSHPKLKYVDSPGSDTPAELYKDKASNDGEDYGHHALLPLLENNRDAVKEAREVEDITECHFLLLFLWRLPNKESCAEKSKKDATRRDSHQSKKPSMLKVGW